jgi:putative glycosyltransferase (TIGR04372 family)
MQKRVLPFNQLFLPLFDVCHKLGGLGVSSTELHDITGRDPKQLIPATPKHIDFTAEEGAEARRQCRELGVDPDAPFVSVLGRDPSYLAHIGEPTDNDSYRNVDIGTFIPAMEYLADTHQVLRMGSVVRDRLHTRHPRIIDYSLSGKRSELLDVYLSARCRFFFSCGTGLDSIAACCFRLPVLYVDYIPFDYASQLKPGAIFIPKKFWNTREDRYVTLSEILESEIKTLYTPGKLTPLDIAVHDNTPGEILEATKEMVARLDGTWQDADGDEERQARFWALYREKVGNFKCEARIGASFLRENPSWLK